MWHRSETAEDHGSLSLQGAEQTGRSAETHSGIWMCNMKTSDFSPAGFHIILVLNLLILNWSFLLLKLWHHQENELNIHAFILAGQKLRSPFVFIIIRIYFSFLSHDINDPVTNQRLSSKIWKYLNEVWFSSRTFWHTGSVWKRVEEVNLCVNTWGATFRCQPITALFWGTGSDHRKWPVWCLSSDSAVRTSETCWLIKRWEMFGILKSKLQQRPRLSLPVCSLLSHEIKHNV